MPGSVDELTIAMRLRGARTANAQLNETAASINKVNMAARRSTAPLGAMGAGFTRTGRALTRNLSLPLAAGAAYATKFSIDFSNRMRMVQTQAGASAREVAKLTPRVLELAKVSPQGPNELADGLFRIESHGIRGAKALRTLKASADLAMVGNSNLEDTTYALAAAQQTHIKGTETEAKTAAMLNAIVGQGSMRMEELNGALSTGVLLSGKSFGLTLRDVGSALDVLTSKGMPAQQSATRLRMSFSLLAAPSDKADKMLRKIHLSGMQLAETFQKKDGLLHVIEMIRSHMEGMDKAQRATFLSRAFGGGRSSAAIIALVQSAGELEQRMKGVSKQTRNYNADVAASRNEPINKLRTAWSSIQVAMVKIGAALTPLVVHIANGLAKIADALAGHPTAGIAILSALILLGPALRLVGFGFAIMRAQAELATGATIAESVATNGLVASFLALDVAGAPIWAIIGALVVLGIGIYEVVKHWRTLLNVVKSVWSWIKSHIKWVAIFAPGIAVVVELVKHFKDVKRIVMDVVHWVEKAVHWLGKLHMPHVPSAGGLLGHIPGAGLVSGIAGHLGFANGGDVGASGPYWVGERGPEIVNLRRGDHVTANHDLGELVTVPISIEMDGRVVAQTVARVVADRKARS